ncbi:MAG: hypothetical protein R3C11_22085 [Planctomycetaceae bacterium]
MYSFEAEVNPVYLLKTERKGKGDPQFQFLDSLNSWDDICDGLERIETLDGAVTEKQAVSESKNYLYLPHCFLKERSLSRKPKTVLLSSIVSLLKAKQVELLDPLTQEMVKFSCVSINPEKIEGPNP